MRKSEIRIIAGSAKGRSLFSVDSLKVRPGLASVRKSVFDILVMDIADSYVADFFAGTGSIGLEALSRGASHCIFVENDPEVYEALSSNVAKLGFGASSTLIDADVFSVDLSSLGAASRLDILFINPPYALFDSDESLQRFDDLFAKAVGLGLLGPDSLVVLEHRSDQSVHERFRSLKLKDRREYGGTHVSFFLVK